MSNLQRHKDCEMRSEIGNCLAIGGFCTSVSKEICEALQNAYTNGKHSVEVSEDCISREWLYNELNKVTAVTPTQIDMLSDFTDIIKNAPSVVPTNYCPDCGAIMDKHPE